MSRGNAKLLRRCLYWAVGDDAAEWESGDGWPIGRFLVPALAGDYETAARELAAHEAEYNAAQAEASEDPPHE